MGFSQNSSPIYLNPNASVENRVNDLMDRMTLEEKVYQMNQFVGLDHMRKAEKDLTEEDYSFLTANVDQVFQKGKYTRKELIKRIDIAIRESNLKSLRMFPQ